MNEIDTGRYFRHTEVKIEKAGYINYFLITGVKKKNCTKITY